MTNEENNLRREYRLLNISNLEELEGRHSKTLSFGSHILVAGYYYEYKKPCYFGAVYTYSTAKRLIDEDAKLEAISTEKFEDDGHAIEWAMKKAYELN